MKRIKEQPHEQQSYLIQSLICTLFGHSYKTTHVEASPEAACEEMICSVCGHPHIEVFW